MTRNTIATWLMRAGCILFCVTLPFFNLVNNVGIELIVLAWLVEARFREKFSRLTQSILIFPVAFYLLHIVGLLYTTDFTSAFKDLETKAALLLLPLCLGTTFLIDRNWMRHTLRTFVLINLAVCIFCFGYAFVRYSETGNLGFFYYHTLTEVIDLHAIYFGLYLGFSILVLLYYQLFDSPLFPRTLTIVLVVLYLIVIVFLSALVVMFVLPFLIFYLISGKMLKHWSAPGRIVLFVGVLVAFCLAAYSLPYTRTKLQRLTLLEYSMGDPDYKWGSLTIRLAKWECAMDVLKTRWLFGAGTGDAQNEMMESYRKHGFAEGLRNNYNTHNQYLETWIMLGLPGLVLLAAMLWPFAKNELDTCFLTLIAASMFTENILDTQKGVVFLAFFYALLRAGYWDATTPPIPTAKR